MDHQEALAAQAVERYLLNDLSSSQKESFEEHFFGCPECAAALREHEIFRANARAVMQQTPAPGQGIFAIVKTWLRWPVLVPALAAILIGILGIRSIPNGAGGAAPRGPDFVYQQDLSPQLRGGSAGDVDQFRIPANATAVQFRIDLLPGSNPAVNRWAQFRWEIRDAGGRIEASSAGSATKDMVRLALPPVPVRSLSPGRHQLILHPLVGDEGELVSSFLIQ